MNVSLHAWDMMLFLLNDLWNEYFSHILASHDSFNHFVDETFEASFEPASGLPVVFKEKIKQNKLSWIKEQRETIEQFKKQKAPEFYQQFRPDGYSVDKENILISLILI